MRRRQPPNKNVSYKSIKVVKIIKKSKFKPGRPTEKQVMEYSREWGRGFGIIIKGIFEFLKSAVKEIGKMAEKGDNYNEKAFGNTFKKPNKEGELSLPKYDYYLPNVFEEEDKGRKRR